MVKAFGERTLEIIDADPHNLTFVEGIEKHRKALIVTAWAEQKTDEGGRWLMAGNDTLD